MGQVPSGVGKEPGAFTSRSLQVEELSSNPEVQRKQKELKEINEKIDFYKKEIATIK